MLDPGWVYYYFNLFLSFVGLLVLFSPVVIGFVIRRKWRLAVVRREEIKRLLVLASEEAARAELEASSGYVGPVSVSAGIYQSAASPVVFQSAASPGVYQCAVCYSPTTTRCARCKSVRYCSGKCQIIHWRQGHKEECHPASTTYQNINDGNSPRSKAADLVQSRSCDDHSEIEEDQPVKPVETNHKEPNFPKINHAKDSRSKKDDAVKSELLSSAKKKVSIFTTSESSDDVSISESTDITSTNPNPTQANNLSNSQPIPKERAASKSSDSGSLHFSFNLSGNKFPQADSHSPVINNSTVSNGVHKAGLQKYKVINEADKSVNIDRDSPKKTIVQSSSFERSSQGEDDNVTDPPALGLKELDIALESTFIDSLKDTKVSSLKSKSSNHLMNGMSTSNCLKEKELQTLVVSASNGHILPSSNVGNLVRSVKTGSDSSQIASTSSSSDNGLKTSMKKDVDHLKVSKLSKNTTIEVGSGTLGRYNDKGLFSYELFIKLYSWNKVELLPRGLSNCGNSCFANVVFQCLAFTPPLHAYLLQGFHSKACHKKEWCFTCEFESLILKVKEGNSPLSPLGILSQLRNIGSHLGNGREEDAHEFLRYIIDKMQSVCLKEAEQIVSGSTIEATTLIGLTFGGYLRSKIKCMKCQGKSERHDRIMDLTVEIEGDIQTLEGALKKFTSTEILDGENKYQCNRCKTYVKAKKKLKISEAPNVLTIALKRFQSGKFGKLNKSIEFPEILDLAKYMSGTSDKSPIYKLYGVIVHLDVMNAAFSGHYVCYVKNNQNRWFKIDDSTVKPVELKKVKEKEAYMLFYARYSPRAPKLLRNLMFCVSKPKPSTHNSIPTDNPSQSSSESIYSGPPIKTIFETDSSSDNASLFSSCSDEGSCSTESNVDSIGTDDFSDYIFGRVWRQSSDSDTSSSSSSGRNSPIADLGPYDSSKPNDQRMIEELEGKRSELFLHSRDLGSKIKVEENFKFSESCRKSTSMEMMR